MIENKVLQFEKSQIHYAKAGRGSKVLLFFHGFGQDHSVYVPLIQSLASSYQLYIFDLFFHGRSKWAHGERPLEKEEWARIIQVFLESENVNTFSVVGFSLGGKFALATLEAFAGRTEAVYLIAPDGIKTSFWYSMATYPVLLRRFFKSMVGNYSRFSKLATFLHKIKVVDKGLIRFAYHQMSREEKRKRVYFSWVVFRHLKFDLRKLSVLINQHKIAVTIITGRYDKVIEPKNMNYLLKYLDDYKFEVLESGHSGLIYQSLPFIRKEASR